MSNTDLPLNLLWYRGDVCEFLKGYTKDIAKTIFALYYTSDMQFIFDSLVKLYQKNEDEIEKEYLKVAIALAQFLAGSISESQKTLKSINPKMLAESSGIAREFFASSYVHLMLLLKNYDKELAESAPRPNSTMRYDHVIGDSHVISHGFINQSEFSSIRPIYIPGIKLSHLADPKPNVFKTGFCNALQFASRDRVTYFCMGEIDYRLSFKRNLGTSLKYGYHLQGKQLDQNCIAIQMNIVKRAVEFISSHRALNQQYAILSIQPPNPNFLNKEFDKQDVSAEINLVNSVNEAIKSTCEKEHLLYIDRTEALSSPDGLLDKSLFLDNKHLQYTVHKRIIQDFLMSQD